MTKPASNIKLIIFMITISELELRMEKRLRGISRVQLDVWSLRTDSQKVILKVANNFGEM